MMSEPRPEECVSCWDVPAVLEFDGEPVMCGPYPVRWCCNCGTLDIGEVYKRPNLTSGLEAANKILQSVKYLQDKGET